MKHISVLIVEDSIYAADLNIREIKKAGFTVNHIRVVNGKIMLEALQESKWDIILSDNSMPNFDALKALEIRNIFDRDIPFIIVSEYVSDKDIITAMDNGCNAYITKENLMELRKIMQFLYNIKESGVK